jgi:membrane protein YdbS with pleckstrin-like domain
MGWVYPKSMPVSGCNQLPQASRDWESRYPLVRRPEQKHLRSARKLLITLIALIIIAAVGVIAFTIAAAVTKNPHLAWGIITCALLAIGLTAAIFCINRHGHRFEVRRGFERLPVDNAFLPPRRGYTE